MAAHMQPPSQSGPLSGLLRQQLLATAKQRFSAKGKALRRRCQFDGAAKALRDQMESFDRKGIAQIQRVGAWSDRKSRLTFSENAGASLECEETVAYKLNS